MIKNSFFGVILALFLLQSCGEGQPSCAFGSPTAVFAPAMSFVKNHQFELKERSSSETVDFPDLNLSLEILQSGCETVQQEYRITLNGTLNEVKTAPETAVLVADIFAAISDLDKAKLGSFMQMAQTIGPNSLNFQFNEPLEMQNSDNSNVKISLNLMRQPSKTIISVQVVLG